jgi:hypothetical protein
MHFLSWWEAACTQSFPSEAPCCGAQALLEHLCHLRGLWRMVWTCVFRNSLVPKQRVLHTSTVLLSLSLNWVGSLVSTMFIFLLFHFCFFYSIFASTSIPSTHFPLFCLICNPNWFFSFYDMSRSSIKILAVSGIPTFILMNCLETVQNFSLYP